MVETTYTCDVCGMNYCTFAEAAECEATVPPDKPEHLIGKRIRSKTYGTEGTVKSIGIKGFFGHHWVLYTDTLMKDSDHYHPDESHTYIEWGDDIEVLDAC